MAAGDSKLNAPIDVKPLGGGRPGKGGRFDSNHRPVVGFLTVLMALNGNSQLSSNAPPMPGLPHPPQQLNNDRCIMIALWSSLSVPKPKYKYHILATMYVS